MWRWAMIVEIVDPQVQRAIFPLHFRRFAAGMG